MTPKDAQNPPQDARNPAPSPDGTTQALSGAQTGGLGDVLTTPEEVSALPVGTVLMREYDDGTGPGAYVNTRDHGWLIATEPILRPHLDTVPGARTTVLHVPGEPPARADDGAQTGHGVTCDPACRCDANIASGRGGNRQPIPPTHVLVQQIALLERERDEARAQVERVNDLFRWADCHEAVVDADGEEQPCSGIAIAWRVEPEEREVYPVCVEHIRPPMASLAGLLAALAGSEGS